MAIEGMQSILRQRAEQYSRMGTPQSSSKDDDTDEALKIFFDYIKASNEQLMGVCATILDNQKILELKLMEIDKKLDTIKVD